MSNCGRFAVARTERTAKRLACWLPRPPAEQPARHVRWPTCPSLRYEQRVGLQAGDKLLCCRPQKTAKPSKGACPRTAAEAPAAQERGLSAPARSRFPLPVAVRSAARAARSTAAVGRGAAAGQARAWITTRPERRYLRPSEQHPPEEAPEYYAHHLRESHPEPSDGQCLFCWRCCAFTQSGQRRSGSASARGSQ